MPLNQVADSDSGVFLISNPFFLLLKGQIGIKIHPYPQPSLDISRWILIQSWLIWFIRIWFVFTAGSEPGSYPIFSWRVGLGSIFVEN